jgi:hypothetical protein
MARFLTCLGLFVTGLGLVPLASAQRPINERNVTPGPNVQDRGEITTLHFDFKDPRMALLDVPGRGKRVVWYMTYWVTNYSKEPFHFYPEFILLTNLKTLHHDEVIPEVFEQIRRIEDPSDRFKFQSSITISKRPIPVSTPDALPRRVAGIALWTDIQEKAPNTASFRIFVNGLSNGWAIDDEGAISRKTLMLEFERRGDGSRVDSSEIVYRNIAKWFYRDASSADVDLQPPASVRPAGK